MNHHPLHLDASYAQSTSFGERVVVGTYVLSLVVGLSVADISGKAIANLSYRDIQHHAPVFIGDTLRAETTILQARPSQSHPDAGIVEVETRAYKQDNTLVLSLRRTLMVPRREA
jgi:acyl dehydratase